MAYRITQDAIDHFVEDLKATHGENLSSVVLFGASTVGREAGIDADYNVLIALRRITPDDLRASQAPVREWQRIGHPVPVFFTTEELSDAADVFPIEFRQMERDRKVLFGTDPFEFIQLTDEHLRHQTEYELRSKLIQLRRLYIPNSSSATRLGTLMTDSLASFAALFRAVLLLFKSEPPVSKVECVRETVRLLKLDGAPFEQIFALNSNREASLDDGEAHRLFADYMRQIENVIEAVDSNDITARNA
jgi:hypothetical protein